MKGLILKFTGSFYYVKLEGGEVIKAKLKGSFKIRNIKATNPLAVGDFVEVMEAAEKDTYMISEIYPRKNYIIRKSINLSKQYHIIASNVDQIFVVFTICNPKTFLVFLDKILVLGEAYRIPVSIIFNKMDIYSPKNIELKNKFDALYTSIGYDCYSTSTKDEHSIEKIKNKFIGKTSILLGISGVGKSSILNSMYEGVNIKTAKLSTFKKGRHTTTFSQIIQTNFGANIIDTPGVKEWGFIDISRDEIGDYFPEFIRIKNKCKYNDCIHIDEPDCAIKRAIEKNEINPSRYKSYKFFLYNLDDL